MTDNRKRARPSKSSVAEEPPVLPELLVMPELTDPKARELLGVMNTTHKYAGRDDLAEVANAADTETFETLRDHLTAVDIYLNREEEALETAYLGLQGGLLRGFFELESKVDDEMTSDKTLEEFEKNAEYLLQSIKFHRLKRALSAKFPHEIFD